MASGSYNTAMCLNPDEKSVMSPSEDSLKREVILLRRKLQELEKENQSLKKNNNDMQIAVEQPEENKQSQEIMQDTCSINEENNVDAGDICEPLTAESIAEAAESALALTGWVYDKATDTYFDYNTKLYYYPSTQLYYNYSNGCYYRYNQKSKQYDFHHKHNILKQKPSSCDATTQTLNTEENQESSLICSHAAVARMTARTEQTSSLSDSEIECIKSYQEQIMYDGTILTKSSKNHPSKRPNTSDKEIGFQLCHKKKFIVCRKCGKFIGTDFTRIRNQNAEDPSFQDELESTRVNQNKADVENQTDQLNVTSSSGFVKYSKYIEREHLMDDEISDTESFMKYSMVANQEQEENKSPIPCIRAMVITSEVLETGTLFIIPCTGATVGSSEYCDINIEEEEIDDEHVKLFYHTEQKHYFAADLGSSTGTGLDSIVINKPMKISIFPTPIHHKSILSIGTTVIELHIHPGYDTCDECEPGKMSTLTKRSNFRTHSAMTSENKEVKRRYELKGLKKKFGLHKEMYKNPKPLSSQYLDRALKRRQIKGSDNPYEKDEFPTSVNTEISVDNKGCRMLKQMGWKAGKGLGKLEKGITEPIQAWGTAGKKFGLGFPNQDSR